MMSPDELARTLAQRLENVRDPELRVRYVRHELFAMETAEIAGLLTVAVHGTEARDASQGALLLSICLALADEECSELRERVAAAAMEQGHPEAAALLVRGDDTPSEDADPAPDFKTGRALTLGERKSLARRRDRDLIARVLRDPHPDVIRILLGNPALTEDDVLRLCARRPVAAEVLREVFRNTRWVVRERVRRAIVKNPFAPLDVALALAAHLNEQDARAVARSPELAAELREACERVAGMTTIH